MDPLRGAIGPVFLLPDGHFYFQCVDKPSPSLERNIAMRPALLAQWAKRVGVWLNPKQQLLLHLPGHRELELIDEAAASYSAVLKDGKCDGPYSLYNSKL